MFVVQMHGLPGSGKSAVATALARETGAVVLDKDVIKSALLRWGFDERDAGGASYRVFFDQAADLVRRGHGVILDSPVFWPEVERKSAAVAANAGVPYFMIQCVCPDDAELRRRLVTRHALESQPRAALDLRRHPGSIEPQGERLVLNTLLPLTETVAMALGYIGARSCA
jgi:predicted kinase